MMQIADRSKATVARTLLCCALLCGSALASANPAPWVGKQLNGTQCSNPRPAPGGGPFDYRDKSHAGQLDLVENAHFNQNVEQLVKGKTGKIMDDLDFVLRAFPNHPRALTSAVNYSLQRNKWPPDSAGQPAECYLQRAMKFAPGDGIPYRLYGYYMHRKGKLEEALLANRRAMDFYPSDAMLHYNTGLLLVKLKRYDEAMEIARPLYDAGLTLPGLKNKLVEAGKWKPSAEELLQLRALLEAAEENKAAEVSASSQSEAPAEQQLVPDNAAGTDNGNADNKNGRQSPADTPGDELTKAAQK